MLAEQTPILIVPGRQNSDPGHWQSLWEAKYPSARRVEQRNWDRPVCSEWVQGLDKAIRACAQPVVIVAHSIGCLAVVHWAMRHHRPTRGALLVAPSDPERPNCPAEIVGFSPVPLSPIPFPTILVASSDDKYASLGRARQFSEAWGSRWMEVGPCGHINTASGFGPWPAGEELLQNLLYME